MAERTETTILNFEVDEGQSIESINSLIAANKELRKERNELNLKTDEGKKRAAELNAQIDKNTEKVKNNSSALEKQKQNIGNYNSATVQTNKILTDMNGKLGQIHPLLGKAAVGMQAGVQGLKGMSLGAKAFIATGIGAIIAAVGLALGALMKYFQGSEEGQNRLNKIMAIGGAIMEQFMNVVEGVGEVLYDAFNEPQKTAKELGNLLRDQLVNRFVGMLELIPNLGRAVVELFKGNFEESAKIAGDAVGKVTLGVENASDKIIGFVKSTGEAVAQGIAYGEQISALNAQIDKEERKLIEDRAKTNLQVSKLRQQAVELEGQAKIDAVKQAIALEEGLAAREMELAKQRVALAELQIEANGDDKDALNEAAEARARLTQAESLAYDNTLKFRKELERLNEEAAKAEEERAADERARQRAESGGSANIPKDDPEVANELRRSEAILNIKDRLNKDLQKRNDQQVKSDKNRAEAQMEIDRMVEDQKIAAAQAVTGAVLGFLDQESDAYKAVATFQTLVSTYSTAQKAYEAGFVPPTPASPVIGGTFAAAAILTGLANVARINGVEFAEGGWTGPGRKWDVAGVVHADEYVVPKHIVNNPAAQHHVGALERMRLAPYADGGLVTRSISNPINQSMDINRAIQEMQFVLDVRQVTKQQRAIEVKQAISKR